MQNISIYQYLIRGVADKIRLTTVEKIKSGVADFTDLPAGVYLLQLALPNG